MKDEEFEIADKRKTPFMVFIPEKLKKAVNERAWTDHISMAEWIRRAIKEKIDREPIKK